MIILTFRPLHGDSPVLVRGEYFRICEDGTLRGPHNDVVAAYADGIWRLRHREQRAFECSRPVYLRVTDAEDRREYIGPYEFVRVEDGALFTLDNCLGDYSRDRKSGCSPQLWREVAILSAAT